MMKKILLEIGTEEIPAKFLPDTLVQLKDLTEQELKTSLIDFSKVSVYATPRRLAVIIEGVASLQAKNLVEAKGPATKIAYNENGTFSKAVMGFLRGQGLDAESLKQLESQPFKEFISQNGLTKSAVKEIKEQDNYIYAIKEIGGQEVAGLLPELFLKIINLLHFPKSMHWGDLDFRFVRPIHWLVALFGNEVIDIEVAGVKSGKHTLGHRFLSEGKIEINSPDDYITKLEEQFVLVEQDKRREIIRKQIIELAKNAGGKTEIDEDLLEEVVYLVEYPTALIGNFDKEFLSLPKEAIITPMREHQRYFPVFDENNTLLPLFITVRNGGDKNIQGVANGNERVLRARLSDAVFFFNEDKKVLLDSYVEKLKTVVFQEGLGSIYDKTQRLRKLAAFFVQNLIKPVAVDMSKLDRTAELSKADLVTGMVNEFTELQGVMGREYAKLSGEDIEVCTAIFEHNLPRFAEDDLPQGSLGRVISIVDKVDNIVATFSRGLIPTGSQDPYFLRRQAIGIINILAESGYRINLSALFKQSMSLFNIEADKQTELLEQLNEFFQLRIKNILIDREIRYDLVDAVLASGIDDIAEVFKKAQALKEFAQTSGQMKQAVEAFTRVANITKKAPKTGEVTVELLTEQAEKNLFTAYSKLKEQADKALINADYVQVLNYVADLAEPVNTFFDNVMVMVEDEKVKNNRLLLLQKIKELATVVADLSCIVLQD